MADCHDIRLYVEDISVGDTGPEIVVDNLERADLVKYAGASGDFNRLHYDEPFAKATGNKSVLAQGMFTSSVLSRMVTNWMGTRYIDAFETRFVAPVWPGDTIRTTGEITDVDRESGAVKATIEVANDDDDTVVLGSVSATLPSRKGERSPTNPEGDN